jgi:hypothetical protein
MTLTHNPFTGRPFGSEPSKAEFLARAVVAQVFERVAKENPTFAAELPKQKWVALERSSLVHWTIESRLEKPLDFQSLRELIRIVFCEVVGKKVDYCLMRLYIRAATNYLYGNKELLFPGKF